MEGAKSGKPYERTRRDRWREERDERESWGRKRKVSDNGISWCVVSHLRRPTLTGKNMRELWKCLHRLSTRLFNLVENILSFFLLCFMTLIYQDISWVGQSAEAYLSSADFTFTCSSALVCLSRKNIWTRTSGPTCYFSCTTIAE